MSGLVYIFGWAISIWNLNFVSWLRLLNTPLSHLSTGNLVFFLAGVAKCGIHTERTLSKQKVNVTSPIASLWSWRVCSKWYLSIPTRSRWICSCSRSSSESARALGTEGVAADLGGCLIFGMSHGITVAFVWRRDVVGMWFCLVVVDIIWRLSCRFLNDYIGVCISKEKNSDGSTKHKIVTRIPDFKLHFPGARLKSMVSYLSMKYYDIRQVWEFW